jgi:phosphoglycerate kinase
MPSFKTLDDTGAIKGKRILVRVDFNVPVEAGRVTDSSRIDRALPTINELTRRGARVVLVSHFGRPKGKQVDEFSLEQILPALTQSLGKITFAADCIGKVADDHITSLADGEILLMENVRFHEGEKQNSQEFAKALAENGDIYVNDAFSACHRSHASTDGVAHLLPAFAGRAFEAELDCLSNVLDKPDQPVFAFVGGFKVSDKLGLLTNLLPRVDALVIGGAMANTFLLATGHTVGASAVQEDLVDTAQSILLQAKAQNCTIVLPTDVVVAPELRANAAAKIISVDVVENSDMILDIGAQTVALIDDELEHARTVIWNGPMGAFEFTPFDKGTVATARHVARRTVNGQLKSVAGGGDTMAALKHAGVAEDFTYVSAAGGAFLEWLEGKDLPGLKALENA